MTAELIPASITQRGGRALLRRA